MGARGSDRPYIPKDKLILGEQYYCDGRNFSIGRWTTKGFEYLRHKFGRKFIDYEDHWDDGPPYGTVKPYEIIRHCPHCDGEVELDSKPHDSIDTAYWFVCKCCAATSGWAKSVGAAVKMHNMRECRPAIPNKQTKRE